MKRENRISKDSVLFVTLDSCRYDTFETATAPVMKSISALYRACAPSHFTYGSHAAMFAGFTPGVAAERRQFLNPKYARLFRLHRPDHPGLAAAGYVLTGEDIVDGFRQEGYETIGSAALGWFDPANPVSWTLRRGFEKFQFAGRDGIQKQVAWIERRLRESTTERHFVFLNIGETHVPYHFDGASWPDGDNCCEPFGAQNSADICRERQSLCCEYVDRVIAPLIDLFSGGTIMLCADHGDCWGEDGLWEHGFSHEMTLTVPLLIRYKGVPVEKIDCAEKHVDAAQDNQLPSRPSRFGWVRRAAKRINALVHAIR